MSGTCPIAVGPGALDLLSARYLRRMRPEVAGHVGFSPLHTRKVAASIPAGTTSSQLHSLEMHNICTRVAPYSGKLGWSDDCALLGETPNIAESLLLSPVQEML